MRGAAASVAPRDIFRIGCLTNVGCSRFLFKKRTVG